MTPTKSKLNYSTPGASLVIPAHGLWSFLLWRRAAPIGSLRFVVIFARCCSARTPHNPAAVGNVSLYSLYTSLLTTTTTTPLYHVG